MRRHWKIFLLSSLWATASAMGFQQVLNRQETLSQNPQTAATKSPTAVPEYRVGEIKVTGAKLIKSEFLVGGLEMVSGEVFNEARLQKGLVAMKKFYGALGYAEFLPVLDLKFDEQQKVVNVTVNVDEGRRFTVNRVRFTGNTRVADEVIQREIAVKEGYAFNTQALDESLLRLNGLGLFEEIKAEDVRITLYADEPKLDIDLSLKEKAR